MRPGTLFSPIAQHPCGQGHTDRRDAYAPDEGEPCRISHFGPDQPGPHSVDHVGYGLVFREQPERLGHRFGRHEGARDERERENDDEPYPLRALQTLDQKSEDSREPRYGESEKESESRDRKPIPDSGGRPESDQEPDQDDDYSGRDIADQIRRNVSDE